jgi:hypothetical protein
MEYLSLIFVKKIIFVYLVYKEINIPFLHRILLKFFEYMRHYECIKK